MKGNALKLQQNVFLNVSEKVLNVYLTDLFKDKEFFNVIFYAIYLQFNAEYKQ